MGEFVDIQPILAKLQAIRSIIASSNLFLETCDVINFKISHIRCLALGSPVHSRASLYQFAYLLELLHHFGVRASLYDPIFDENDTRLFQEFSSTVTVTSTWEKGDSVLYFLPHADLTLTDDLVTQYNPYYILGNNLVSHTDRLTKQKLHQSYQMLSLLVNLIEPQPKEPTDEFTAVKSKKKSRSRFIPPVINYDYSSCYFKAIELTALKNTSGPWSNAFTDLALHIIS